MSSVVSQEQAPDRAGRVAAIYARVSSERQRQDQTIASQTVGLRELAAQRGLLVTEDLVFEDEGFSGASLQRPALERLRDRAAEGAFEILLCHAPDRLARRYAYQVLLLEEFARVGVEVCFAKEPERGGTPEDELLRQFQGMIAEYERAQIRERSRRGKAHRARGGSHAVMSGAPYGYRYVRKSQHMDAFYEIDEGEAEIVREVFDRYTERGESIADIARALSANGVLTRTGKHVWDRSTVWAMLRNPAYHGQAAFGKTQTTGQRAKPTRPVRARGERHGRRETRRDVAPEQWTSIPVPALITDETFELAQARLQENKHYAKRNSREPALLKGILVCRDCGYACWRTSARTTKRRDLLLPLHRLGQLPPRRRARVLEPADPRRRARRARVGRSRAAAVQPHADQSRDRAAPDRAADREPRRSPPRRPGARTRAREGRQHPPDRGLPRTAHHTRRAPRPHAGAAQTRDHDHRPTRRARRRTARRRDLPPARREPRRVPRPPRRERPEPDHRGTPTRHSTRRPRSAHRRRRHHNPTHDPHPNRPQ